MIKVDDIHPVAIRFNPRGEGWTYAGADAATYWQARCPDAEFLYTAEALTLAEQRGRAAGRAEERADIVAWIRERGAECLDENRGAPSLSDIIRHQEFSWAADELEARAKACAERQDGGERE